MIIQILQEGNARFVAGEQGKAREYLVRVRETSEKGQFPIAAILSCSDSRVPPEIIFDQGIGDIFSVRIAGNVCCDSQLGAIEFGVKNLGITLCVVLGHTKCNAVAAVCNGQELGENIQTITAQIKPAFERTKAATGKTGEEIVEECIKENIFVQIETILTKSGFLREQVRSSNLLIVGAVYDLDTGVVTFLGPHPQCEELVS
ncbi:MAG: carbonic anhydrase [Planctomycetaceae bacterium]|nr:carbonic anhydrase [Planctomycetaceae bacterium]